ncbi:hypothetical protein [Tautonia plasticadhaerens]|nr:hypothetical protein [Tautonia plasticadhaerens]
MVRVLVILVGVLVALVVLGPALVYAVYLVLESVSGLRGGT